MYYAKWRHVSEDIFDDYYVQRDIFVKNLFRDCALLRPTRKVRYDKQEIKKAE
jgi:hypothetical protein